MNITSFEAMLFQLDISCVVTPCSVVVRHQCFFFILKVEAAWIFVTWYSTQYYTVSQFRRP